MITLGTFIKKRERNSTGEVELLKRISYTCIAFYTNVTIKAAG